MADLFETAPTEIAIGGKLLAHAVGSLQGDGRLRGLEEVGSIVACDAVIVTTKEDLLPLGAPAIRLQRLLNPIMNRIAAGGFSA
ncbi:hypothetical protein LPU83_pLPU83d_1752 (plasmid) [Rhizobium favelukesii]|uniref:Uncharacterized protein n=1 Tax=Rhizobium favelukesii TaxID=348824 RepID=W6RPZ5_9HYPH|nr:hypothetical protein LPU83_pLPU83d_1752 [Rhizobium favelukesii]